jgi:hypothetical protein
MNKIMIGTVGFFLVAATPVFASSSTDSYGSKPQVKNSNNIAYVSGGFGADERANLRAMSKTDNLELSFALQNKDYLGGAEVLIKNDKGEEILKTVSDGPLFFTKLPAGKYTIQATAMGRTEEQVANVPAKGQERIYFAWKETNPQTAVQTLAKK